ncbi:hypothetical protein A4A49_60221 [Nicotiana attenuata]|uniref:Ubiquitin-like protease family profile domain-containing protein n=1 Tax=Nicotiana attenuata TaxID=49451 RepID=A0A314L598_NICAT|nr:hypothetical protein A4A49_60221 [Nicotiana attenuata]
MPESTGGDSQPTDAEVMKELQALKLFVENKFEEVLATIGKQSMKSMKPEKNSAHKQQYNDPDFREMHNDFDQFESGHVGNDPVVIGDSTPKAPSISGFAGVGQDGCATGVNVKNVTASDGVVNEDLPSAPFVNEHDFGFDSNFDLSASAIDQITAITQQATYKQSSHDVKKSGPAPLSSGIPVQTRADVVIESNTAPQACRVDGVGQVDVGGSNVNLPSVQNGLHMGKELTDPFEIELITNLPTQQNSDCGVYVACFAEYIIEDLPIPVANFDVDGLRARFGILLWHYGRNKQLHGESSEFEAPVAPKKTRGK